MLLDEINIAIGIIALIIVVVSAICLYRSWKNG